MFFIPVATLLPKVLGFVRKVPLWFWLIGVIGVGYWHYNGKLDDAKAEIAQVLLAGDSTVVLLDGQWNARLAQKVHELESAKELADELNAELVASVTVTITPTEIIRDTVRLITRVLDDSTRIATLSDTSAFAVLDLSVIVPPCCADIKIRFTLMPQPIKFDVALVRLADDKAVFAISYFGGTTQISTPYIRLPAKIDRFKPFVGVGYDFLDEAWSIQGGAELALVFGVKIDAFLQQAFVVQDNEQSLRLLVRGRKYF